MKKIYFIIPDIYSKGGLTNVTITIMNELANLGLYDVTALSLLCNRSENANLHLGEKVHHIDLPLQKFYLRKDFIKVTRELHKVIPKEFDGTIVVDDIGYIIPVWLGLHDRKRARFICWTHTNYFNGSKFGFSGIGKLVGTKYFDRIIVLTKEDAGHYKKIDKRNIVTQIYNPINSGVAKDIYHEDEKKIISCGRLHKIKGFDYLIEVARIVFQKHPDWRWDIYGEGPEKENLQTSIKKYNLTEQLHLKGYAENILTLYKQYSFNVFTSRGEGCPLAMIEAMSAGLPVISFDFHCGPKDLISEGVNGFIIENYNIQKMAEKICMLIENKQMRIEFASHADHNLKEFEMDYVLKRWKEIL